MSSSQRDDPDPEGASEGSGQVFGRELLVWLVVVTASLLVVAGSALR